MLSLLPITKLRLTILFATAVAETVSLYLCYGQRCFIPFLLFSLWAISLALPLLWIDWIRQRGVSYSDIFPTIMAGFMAIGDWQDGAHITSRILAVLFAALFILGAIFIPLKLFRAVGKTQGGPA
jgi:hypothetical protein